MKRWHEELTITLRNWRNHRQTHIESNKNSPYDFNGNRIGEDPYKVNCECDEQIGRFRKKDAYDCGKTRCSLCHSDKSPKRQKTKQEINSDYSFKEQLIELRINMNVKQMDRILHQLNAVIILWVVSMTYVVILCMFQYDFDWKCTKDIKVAAYAKTPEFAQYALEKVFDYAIDHNLVEGNSGVLTFEPKDDLKNWILKLNSLIVKLKLAKTESDDKQAEIMAFVKKSLISDKNQVIMPDNLAFYPYQNLVIIPLIVLTILFSILSAITYTELGVFVVINYKKIFNVI